jgi:uncharacterized repeat protein (TIGR01451 family)
MIRHCRHCRRRIVPTALLLAASCGGSPEVVTRSAALTTGPALIATATLDRATDLAGFAEALENGLPQNVLGGLGSGLTWAGGTTFLGVPDRGPNATPYPGGAQVDNTVSFIARVETLALPLAPAGAGPLPFVLSPTLQATTLLWSDTALAYGTTPGLPSAVPAANAGGRYHFTGRSDNFGAGLSTNPGFARLDPEAIRVSADGNSVFVADEYGPYVYRFDRATGRRLRSYDLPDHFAIAHLSSVGATEIATNTVGRVTNKGVEGLAITPDGSTLVALVQSPLLQDGGDGGRANRLVTIDVATGATHEYVYDNVINKKAFNSSEIVALNDHQLLIDTRDGKGLGDGSVAVVKQLWAVDITGAQDVSALSGEATLLARAVPKKLFLDIVAVLNANGIASTAIPAKIEGLALGPDVVLAGTTTHTLYVGNDNDFVPDVAGPSRWYVFGFTDADLAALALSYTPQQLVERGPDLALTKSAATATVVTGSTVDFTLAVTNTGLVPAANVLVADVLPPALTPLSCAAAQGSCTVTTGGATFSLPTLAGTEQPSAVVSTRLACDVASGTVIVNQASASFALADPTPADNAASASITALNPPPTISGTAVDQPVLWPPNGKMEKVTVDYGVTDNCPGTTCSLAVASSEPAPGSAQIVDAHTVLLRAERNATGPGRTYTITATCVDSGAASSTAATTVLVPHNL